MRHVPRLRRDALRAGRRALRRRRRHRLDPGEPGAGLRIGSGSDPFRIVTTVEAGDTGMRVEQTDSYVIGEESYRTDVRIVNGTGGEQRVVVFRAADCYLQDSDQGFGRVDNGAPACVISQESDARIEQWVPISPGSRYVEGGYSTVWQLVSEQAPFPNTCLCDQSIDNGAGLSWEANVARGGGSVTLSHLTFFSPEGRQAGNAHPRRRSPARPRSPWTRWSWRRAWRWPPASCSSSRSPPRSSTRRSSRTTPRSAAGGDGSAAGSAGPLTRGACVGRWPRSGNAPRPGARPRARHAPPQALPVPYRRHAHGRAGGFWRTPPGSVPSSG